MKAAKGSLRKARKTIGQEGRLASVQVADTLKAAVRDKAEARKIRDTGNLIESVRGDLTLHKGKAQIVITSEAIDPVNGVDYAPFQEYGTRHFLGRPFFYSSIREKMNDAIRSFRKRIISKINKALQ